jgi:alcohol-forming fatty acyl-CoA reductase
MDTFLSLSSRKPIFLRIQRRISKAVSTLEFFTSKQWEFSNDNIYMLMKEMNDIDNKLFNIDVRYLHWSQYIEQYCLGTKKYCLKEDMSKMSQCRSQLKRLNRIQNFLQLFIFFSIVKFCFFRSISMKQICILIFRIVVNSISRMKKLTIG